VLVNTILTALARGFARVRKNVAFAPIAYKIECLFALPGRKNMNWFNRNIVKNLVVGRAAWEARRFEAATRDGAESQRRLLLAHVRRNEDSDRGRDWNLREVSSVEDFRRVVPLTSYADYSDYIERAKRGKARAVLGPRERLLMFAVTSGTTDRPKYLPITKTFLRDFRRGWLTWGLHTYRDHPEAFEDSILQITSPTTEGVCEANIPCGSVSGLVADMQPGFVHGLYTVPIFFKDIEDPMLKYYLIMRRAVERSVSFITCANPSTLILLAVMMDAHKEELVRCIRDGTFFKEIDVPRALAERLGHILAPNPKRSAELERVLKETGTLRPRDVWPRLRLIATWKGGTLRHFLLQLPQYYGTVPVRDLGLLASEGRMSIPLGLEGCAGVLDVMSSFYEFIPEEETENAKPTCLLMEELEIGKAYSIVLTTSAGLYRYVIHDIVKVVDRHNRTPVIEFLNKGAHIVNITGEKLSEFHVVSAMEATCRQLGHVVQRFVFYPVWNNVPCYCGLLECDGLDEKESLQRFLEELERNLCRVNVEYAGKRKSQRIGPLRLKIVRPSGAGGHRDVLSSSYSKRLAQHKPVHLVGREEPCDAGRVVAEAVITDEALQWKRDGAPHDPEELSQEGQR